MKTIEKTSYTTFNDLWNNEQFLQEEEKARIALEVALIGKIIEARENKGITQKKLSSMTGLKQPAIARLENLKATPQLDTILKILKPLGYTLAIVPDTDAKHCITN